MGFDDDGYFDGDLDGELGMLVGGIVSAGHLVGRSVLLEGVWVGDKVAGWAPSTVN